MMGFRDSQLVWRFVTMSKVKPKKVRKNAKCWLCGREGPTEIISTRCETPGGKPCKLKYVPVHFGCLMDMDY